MKSQSQQLSEFALIDELSKLVPLSTKVIKGIGDDAAVLPLQGGYYPLLTTDMLAEGVHFKKNADPRLIGRKALACNISDIAAMGGIPTHAVVSIAVARWCTTEFVKNIYYGMSSLARQFNVSIVGGDTIAAKACVINIALQGEVQKKHLTLRSEAQCEDWIWVTGPLGRAWKTNRHLTFTPRVTEAQFLVKQFKPSAMLDISDGLSGDLGHILKQSGVGGQLFQQEIPLNQGATVNDALYDGEDFELLFTLSKVKSKALVRWQERHHRWFFYPIGQITKAQGLTLMDAQGNLTQVPLKGYTHF